MKPGFHSGILALAVLAAAAHADDQGPNNLQSLMFFRSFVQNDDACAVTVEGGEPVFAAAVAGSAPSTCPDAFAWVQFAEAVKGEFWTWGIDQTVWPASPLPLCSDGVTSACCDPNAAIDPDGPQPTQCPVYRADYNTLSAIPATPNGTPSRQVINHRGLVSADRIDPGRLLRDLELELVFRNKPMVDYIYRQDLYTKEGLGARNKAQNAALAAGDIGRAHRLEVGFPVDAVMVKADFVHQEILLDLKLIEEIAGSDTPNNPDYPYLTWYLEGDGSDGNVPGMYYLIAMTNASKDLPIWHWYAMEHVANKGRCDYIGCNDSYGYTVDATAQAGADYGNSYIPPKIGLNDDRAVPETGANPNDPLFITGKVYDPGDTGETITDGLKALLDGMGVGTAATDSDPNTITPDDPAWRNYRLKGTQTTFTTSAGLPTGMGATVTEGGFVNSASCTTCHAQAASDDTGNVALVGVGSTWRPNLMGYNQVVMGAPNQDWFYVADPGIRGTQIDFVWGILNAVCSDPADPGNAGGACTSIPDAPTIVPQR